MAADPISAGRELKVDAVLEGTIQSQPEAVRVTLRLLRVADGRTIWSGSLDQPALQLFRLEDSVASQVAAALAIHVNGEEKKLLARHATENEQAYQLYLKGRYFWGRRSEDGFQKAIGYFEQAIQSDPNYALAYAGLADSYMLLGGYRYVSQKDVIERSRAAVKKALQLDPALGEAHTTLALIHENYDWDWPATEGEYRLAIQSNPNYATAHGWYGEFLAYMGRFEESFPEMQRAKQHDPDSVSLNTDACQVFYLARQYDKAIEQCRRALEIDPGFAQASHRLAVSYVRKQMYPEALAEAKRLEKTQGDQSDPNFLGQIYAAAGDRESAQKYWKILRARADSEKTQPFDLWSTALALGNKDEALHWLEKTYDNHGVGLICIKTLPDLDPLRDEPRFQVLMRKMSFVL
jgi:Tfp pilus assembly protein PilF